MAQKDFKEFLELLNKNKVKYLIVGGYALAYHSKPRFTGDIDIWIEPTPENAKKTLNTLRDFGFGELEIEESDIIKEGNIIQLGYPPNRIDLITSIDGVVFKNAWNNRVEGKFGSNAKKVNYISRANFIKNKEALNRLKDKTDIEWIKKFGKKEIENYE